MSISAVSTLAAALAIAAINYGYTYADAGYADCCIDVDSTLRIAARPTFSTIAARAADCIATDARSACSHVSGYIGASQGCIASQAIDCAAAGSSAAGIATISGSAISTVSTKAAFASFNDINSDCNTYCLAGCTGYRHATAGVASGSAFSTCTTIATLAGPSGSIAAYCCIGIESARGHRNSALAIQPASYCISSCCLAAFGNTATAARAAAAAIARQQNINAG